MKKVMIFGTFDGVHAGHRYLFREAKKHGDYLTVVVARDQTVVRIKKKKPQYSECVRFAYLYGEEHIDEVVLGNKGNKHDIIREHHPDVIVLGYDQDRFLSRMGKIFSGEVIRLGAYKPEKYKSSKLAKRQAYFREAKKRLRGRVKALRDAIPPKERKQRSNAIEKLVFADMDVKRAKSVLIYRSIGSEVETDRMMQKFFTSGKRVYVPVLERVGQFSACEVHAETEWKGNRLGVLEPVTKKKYTGVIDVCIVPNLAVTDKGDRLGMGGGYYDRYLGKGKCKMSIGIVYSEQVLSCVPVERWDRRVDHVISG